MANYENKHITHTHTNDKIKMSLIDLVLALICKELASCHSWPYKRKEQDKLKINKFSWIHQKTEGMGQTASLKSGKIVTSKEMQQPRSVYLEQKLLEP